MKQIWPNGKIRVTFHYDTIHQGIDCQPNGLNFRLLHGRERSLRSIVQLR